MNKNVLEVKNLTKKFGNFTAVDNVSFEIKEGEILGLLGPNGAGKTTTIHMLLDVLTPTSGSISYFGKSLKKNRSEILKELNFSSAYISLPWLFTVEEILNVFANLYEVPNKKTRIKRLLSEFEIEHLRKKSVHMLSAGEMARLLLTKAFINYPRVILLDEPTASLDPDIAVKIREFLRRQQKEYKVSMLFTSHNMSEVEEMCDNIIFLNRGKVFAKDKPENLSKQIPESEIELITKNSLKAKTFLESQGMSFIQNKSTFKISLKTKDISTFIALMASKKIEYEDISINKPNLEDYFLKMSEGSNL